MGTGVDTSHCDTSHCARRSRWTFDECAGRRPAIEAVAARPRRGAGANEGLKPRLSRCVAFAALPGAVRRPPRSARRRGAARSSCAAAGCWCPAPAPPPSRGRCAQQPRAAGALCPLRRRAAGAAPSSHGLLVSCARSAAGRPRRRHSRAPACPHSGSPAATQIAQQPHRAATRHFSSPPETRTARGSCLYLPAGARHLPRPIWRYRLRHPTLAAGTFFF